MPAAMARAEVMSQASTRSRGNPELLDDIENAAAAGQANDLVHRPDGIQAGFADLALDQANHVLLHHAGAEDMRHGID